MKKLLIFLLSINIVTSTSLSVISCDQIETFPSKHANAKTSILQKFFEIENNIKPYDVRYIELINNSWEHIGFNNNISTYKIDKSIIELSNEEKVSEFFASLIEIYNPKYNGNVYDFTGLTFYIENIFLNQIMVNENLELTVNSDVAITLKKGWKTVGKILLTLENDELYSKLETTYFINKIMTSTSFGIEIFENTENLDESCNFFIKGNIKQDNFDSFIDEIISKEKVINNLVLKKEYFTYVIDKTGSYMKFDEFLYKIIS
ncbi:hypothetical protein [Spiroplasma litorale]|nr:hypothetical protein [Spiroplasma litorale]